MRRHVEAIPAWKMVLSALVPFALGLALVGATFGEEPDARGDTDIELNEAQPADTASAELESGPGAAPEALDCLLYTSDAADE